MLLRVTPKQWGLTWASWAKQEVSERKTHRGLRQGLASLTHREENQRSIKGLEMKQNRIEPLATTKQSVTLLHALQSQFQVLVKIPWGAFKSC